MDFALNLAVTRLVLSTWPWRQQDVLSRNLRGQGQAGSAETAQVGRRVERRVLIAG